MRIPARPVGPALCVVMLASCASSRVPEPPPSLPPLAPPAGSAEAVPAPAPLEEAIAPRGALSLYRPKASLFGTDVLGLPTGAWITPDAAPGAHLFELDPHIDGARGFRAGNAVAAALSPDGATLLVLTSGYNRVFDPSTGAERKSASSEWVFVYDVSSGAPRETQVLAVPNAFGGIAFNPAGTRFYVAGGSDDSLHSFAHGQDASWREVDPAIALGHPSGLGLGEGPFAAGVAVTASGARVVVANHENDSLSVVDLTSRAVTEIALAPGKGVAGGEFPSSVLVLGESRAFVTCQRDREVAEVDLEGKRVTRRTKVGGQPTKLVATKDGSRLYVANANSDSVSVVDLAHGAAVATLATAAPPGSPALRYRGSNPNALALSSDESRLFVTNGGNDDVAVIDLASRRVVGLIPTGYYPTAVAVARDGKNLFVVSAKSPSGPNPLGPWSATERAARQPYGPGRGNQYALQLERASLLALPLPDAPTLATLTRQVFANQRFDVDPAQPPALFADLARARAVKHVVYVISENRTYDQILGDLPGADGDPRLVLWGASITPNQHALARTFVTLDRFFDAGGVSGEGWQWSTSARTTDVAEKAIPVEYAGRGAHTYDWEGANRGINVSWKTVADRALANPRTPASIDLLPGTADVGAVDGPDEGGRGFLWDAALAAHRTVRNYGAFCDDSRYGASKDEPAFVPPLTDPAATKTRVAFPTRAALHDRTDPYFRGFDMTFADYWRVAEWERDFTAVTKKGDLPALEIVRLPHDHLGAFLSAHDGVTTPDTQIADHDYALGRLVETLSRSPFWKDTVVLALEDDAQNGSDHVDAHRSVLFVAGGHVKRGAHVSTPYATPSVLRTIELLLGLEPLGQKDAFAPPMDELLDARADPTPFVAAVPDVLRSTLLPLPPPAKSGGGGGAAKPRGDAAYWARVTEGEDFSRADDLDDAQMNRALTCGLLGPAACAASGDD